MRATFALLFLLLAAAFHAQAEEASPARPPAAESRAVMTGDQVVQILDATVAWYRLLGIQQQAATQPSDLLILYANRQTAEKLMELAFEIARANAELLSSEAGAARASRDAASSRSLSATQSALDRQRTALQTEIETTRGQLTRAPRREKADLQTRLAVLQGELDMINARRNLLSNMQQYASQTDTNGFGANALKAHIDAIAASIPSASTTGASQPGAAKATREDEQDEQMAGAGGPSLTDLGIWDLTSTVLRISARARTIDAVDRRTAELQDMFTTIRTPPLQQLQVLADRSDTLAAQANSASTANLKAIRDQYDTLAWLYQQTSAMVTPLSKAGVLLGQYRNNLSNWRDSTERQYREAIIALGMRLLLFAGLLALVFAGAELWRRAVLRYVPDARRRWQLLLLRKIVLWALVVAIVAATFATELGSLATFAGLITAGLAVAMQSVLVSAVGYFFLIGKYGVRVGDRVQIGNVTGEVIDLGLVRMHLMELRGEGEMSPTGRVVAFANSVIFQASGGLFKQIPGVNLAWHDITLSLPPGVDYAAMKNRLTDAVANVIKDYRDDIMRQAREIQKTGSLQTTGEPVPQVQLRFTAAGVDALVRYPVQLQHAAEIDERVSRELLSVISAHETAVPAHA